MRQPNHPQFLWQNFEFRVRAIDGLQICSLKPSELDTNDYLSCSECFFVAVNSQKTLTRLNGENI